MENKIMTLAEFDNYDYNRLIKLYSTSEAMENRDKVKNAKLASFDRIENNLSNR